MIYKLAGKKGSNVWHVMDDNGKTLCGVTITDEHIKIKQLTLGTTTCKRCLAKLNKEKADES